MYAYIVHTYIHTYVRTYVCLCMYVLVYASCFEMYGHIYTHIDTHIYIYICIRITVCVLGLQGFSIQDPDRPYFVAGSFKTWAKPQSCWSCGLGFRGLGFLGFRLWGLGCSV